MGVLPGADPDEQTLDEAEKKVYCCFPTARFDCAITGVSRAQLDLFDCNLRVSSIGSP